MSALAQPAFSPCFVTSILMSVKPAAFSFAPLLPYYENFPEFELQ